MWTSIQELHKLTKTTHTEKLGLTWTQNISNSHLGHRLAWKALWWFSVAISGKRWNSGSTEGHWCLVYIISNLLSDACQFSRFHGGVAAKTVSYSLTLRVLMSYIYMERLFLMFLDHTQRRSTVGRTPLDEWSARRRDLYLKTHDTQNRQISMPPVGFEPKISAGERP